MEVDPENIDEQDIQKLNIEKLTDNMLKGIYVLESVLYSQAGYEYKHISRMREVISTLEDDIFDPDTLEQLPLSLKLSLYAQLNKNMESGLGFLQNLHKNISTGLEAIKNIEKHKQRRTPAVLVTPEESVKIDQIKHLIENAIKKKLEEQ